jgi:hypothetical protein
MFNAKNIELKIGRMRKPQDFILYPYKETDENIMIQSNKSIGILHKETKKFIFTSKGSYFHDLQISGQETVLAEEIKDQIIELYNDSKKYSDSNGAVRIM